MSHLSGFRVFTIVCGLLVVLSAYCRIKTKKKRYGIFVLLVAFVYWQVFASWYNLAYIVPYNHFKDNFQQNRLKVLTVLKEENMSLDGENNEEAYGSYKIKSIMSKCNFTRLRSDQYFNVWHLDFPIEKCEGDNPTACRSHQNTYRINAKKWQEIFVKEVFLIPYVACVND